MTISESSSSCRRRDGLAGLKLNLGIRRGVGRVLGILGHNPGVVERLVPGILQVAALNGTTPQVVVDRIGVIVGTSGTGTLWA